MTTGSVLITGAASGIGPAIAVALARTTRAVLLVRSGGTEVMLAAVLIGR